VNAAAAQQPEPGDPMVVCDPETISQHLALLWSPGHTYELRTIGGGDPRTAYFRADAAGIEAAADAIIACDAIYRPHGIYTTLNPVATHLRDGVRHRDQFAPAKRGAARDSDVVVRHAMLIDCDPARASGTSATDAEVEAALAAASSVRAGLNGAGWPGPLLVGMSGNGAHLVYAIDLPADDGGQVARALRGIAARYSDHTVTVDVKVANASRITKVFGTVSRKGAPSIGRPHRMARILEAGGGPREPVTAAQLEAIAAWTRPKVVADRVGVSNANASTGRGDDLYAELETMDQRHVLSCLSGSWVVNGERFDFRQRGEKWAIIVDDKSTSNWIDERGRIGAEGKGGRNGGPLASTYCRYYGHSDAAIRRGLIEFVPELARFADSGAAGSRRGAMTREGAPPSPASDDLQLTELGNAQRFALWYGAEFRYVRERRQWRNWDGQRWAACRRGEEVVAAKRIPASFFDAAAAAAGQAAGAAMLSEVTDTSARATALLKWGKASSKAQAIASSLRLAESEHPIAAVGDDFDADPMLFNCINGTLDLRSGVLRPHSRADLLTKLAPVAYDADARSPLWDDFLARVQPDEEIRMFLQRFAGYSLTGDVGEQVLLFLLGKGANGKSVFLDVLLSIVGDYGLRAAPDLLLAKRSESHPTDQADLRSMRLVVASEVDQGRAWDEAMIKRTTGDTTITARKMRADFETFPATHKVLVAANTKPKVRGSDDGIWRRLKLVPFCVTIPEHERDRGLVARLLATESSGILAWAVRGALDWQEHGLPTPVVVAEATQKYRAEQDVIGNWIDEECVLAPGLWSPKASLYSSFRAWCERGGREPWASQSFFDRLLERDDVEDARRKAARGVSGIRLGLAIHDDREVTR
jgi:putative DNA primase/helicase